jgi:hypothetical protein
MIKILLMDNNIEKQKAQEKLEAHGRKDIIILEYFGWKAQQRELVKTL